MKRLLIAATALALLSGGAYAQTYSGSGSDATAVNTSGSLSSSVSNPQANVIGNPTGNGASSSYSNAGATANTRSAASSSAVGNRSSLRNTTNIVVSSGTGESGTAQNAQAPADQTIRYDGGYTVRNTPEVMPPSVVGGNTCAVGVSGGLSLPGLGIAGGATWADRACERRQQAALMYNMGQRDVAYALMCQDEHVRQAMREAGVPCLQDRPVAAAPAPVRAARAPVPAHVAAATAPARPKPAWCTQDTVSPAHLSTLSAGQQQYIRMNCGT